MIRPHLLSSSAALLLLLLLLPFTCVSSSDSTNNEHVEKHCLLECANDSLCARTPGAEGQKLQRSGRLIDSCTHCPTNYGGIACDIPLHFCTSNRDCAGSSNTCDATAMEGKGLCTNACAAVGAWLKSDIAAYACRKSVTEYCDAKRNPTDFHYCTNGGKCSNNYQGGTWDKSDLCHCPPEFIGTHCERVKLPASVSMPTPLYEVVASSNRVVVALVSALAAVVLAGVTILFWRQRRGHKRRNSGGARGLNLDGLFMMNFDSDHGDDSSLMMTMRPDIGSTRRTSPRSSPTNSGVDLATTPQGDARQII